MFFLLCLKLNLYHEKLGYAGTFDILLAYRMANGEIMFSIHDYKGLPLDTPIKTEDGWKTMGTIEAEIKFGIKMETL